MRIATIALLSHLLAWAAQAQQAQLPVVTLQIEGHEIAAEVAATAEQRRRGLQGRQELPDGTGMLFVFASDGVPCMWMAETPIPLSAAFISAAGQIEKVARMQSYDRTTHCAPGPVRFVLEVPGGWLAERGIGTGSSFSGGPFGN